MLLIGWQEGHLACKKSFTSNSQKVLWKTCGGPGVTSGKIGFLNKTKSSGSCSYWSSYPIEFELLSCCRIFESKCDNGRILIPSTHHQSLLPHATLIVQMVFRNFVSDSSSCGNCVVDVVHDVCIPRSRCNHVSVGFSFFTFSVHFTALQVRSVSMCIAGVVWHGQNVVLSACCVCVQNMAALSSSDAEFMLAMSRTYGSLPLMGCWPTQPPTASTETQLKTSENSPQTGPIGLHYQPAASSISHISDPYMQALIAR